MMQMRANTLGEQPSPLTSLIQYAERSFGVDELEFSLEYTPISK